MRRRGVIFEPFDVVVVPFPFTEKLVTKKRPALVVSSASFNDQHDHLILAMITTAKRTRWVSDVELRDWESANLTVPCKVRFKLFTLDTKLILRRLGSLSEADKVSVQAAIKHFLAMD